MNNLDYKPKHSKTAERRKYFSEIRYQRLVEKYNKSVLTKKELSEELGISVSSINSYIVKGTGIPQYTKIGTGTKGRVLFPIENVVEFLDNTLLVS